MVPSGSPGGDRGCASRERAGIAGLATSVLPLSGPASARDGERAGPPARDPQLFSLRAVGRWEMWLCRRGAGLRDARGLWGHHEGGRKRAGARGEEGASRGTPWFEAGLAAS